MKVTVVGAGAVGTNCAEYIAMKNFAASSFGRYQRGICRRKGYGPNADGFLKWF